MRGEEEKGEGGVGSEKKDLKPFNPDPPRYIVKLKYLEYPVAGPEYPDFPKYPGPGPETPAPPETEQKKFKRT